MTKEKKVEVTPPTALLNQVGENLTEGSRLELMTEFAVKPDGRWCLVRTEGVPWPGYDADGNPVGEEPSTAPTGNFAKNYMTARGPGETGASEAMGGGNGGY